ncbi:unnamed protein product [Candida parapsilosis]
MVKDPITESAKTSSSRAADDTIPVESSSPQMEMSSPLRAPSQQPNALSMHHDKTHYHEFNNNSNNEFDPTLQQFNQNSLLYQLMRFDNTPDIPFPPSVHPHGMLNRLATNEPLLHSHYQQYAFGSGMPQLQPSEQKTLQAQREAYQEIIAQQNEELHRQYPSSVPSQFPVPKGEIALSQTNSAISLNDLDRDNSNRNTATQANFYQGNETSGSFYGDDATDQIPFSANESTTTFLNILDPNQSTDAVYESVASEFSIYNEYDATNASTDSLHNFTQTTSGRARSYQHPSINKDLSHLQFLDVASQRRFQSVNYPPINQTTQSLETQSFMTHQNMQSMAVQDTNMDLSATPTFSDISSFTSSASLHHPIATTSSSMNTFDPSLSNDAVPTATIKTPVRALNSPLANAAIGASSTSHHKISKKPSLSRLKTTSRKNLKHIPGAIVSLEGNKAISSTSPSPSTVSARLETSKQDAQAFTNEPHLQENSPISINEFPYLRSQSQPQSQAQPPHQPQPHLLRTFSNASPSSMAVASTGRPSVLTTPTSAGNGPRSANVFRQDFGPTTAIASSSMLSPGVPFSSPNAELLHRQELWKKNYSLNHGTQTGRSNVTKRKIQRKKSSKLVHGLTKVDDNDVLDPKVKPNDQRDPVLGVQQSTRSASQGNAMGFNSDVSIDNNDGVEVGDSVGSDFGKATLQPTQGKANKLRRSKSTPLLPNTTSDSGINKDQPVKKKYTRRRLLPRSKKGCWICRIKHLKCDEVRPSCGACVRFGLTCDYSPTKPDYVTDKELRQKKLSEITITRKQNQALDKGLSKKGG